MTADTDWLAQLYAPETATADAVDRLTGVIADLHVAVGTLREDRDRSLRLLREQVAQQVYPLAIPARTGVVTSGGVLTIADPEQLGPRMGLFWDVRRVSVYGLASSSESVSLWKVASAVAASAAAQNFVCTLTGPTAFQAFGLGQVMLRANESLMVTGSSLTAAEPVTLSADGFSVAAEWIGLYLL